MTQDYVRKAQELRQHGFTTGEIADQLNVSMDTARWLTLQNPDEMPVEKEPKEAVIEKPILETPNAPLDIAIDWTSLSGTSTRLRYIAGALSDMVLTHDEAEVVVGIAVSGVPFATMVSDLLEDMTGIATSLAVFHPNKHRKDSNTSDEGVMSANFGSVKGKKVVIVDDVMTSGNTMKEVIKIIKDQGGEPVVVTVLIDKSGISEIDGVPVESLIKVSRLG